MIQLFQKIALFLHNEVLHEIGLFLLFSDKFALEGLLKQPYFCLKF